MKIFHNIPYRAKNPKKITVHNSDSGRVRTDPNKKSVLIVIPEKKQPNVPAVPIP